MEQVRLHHQAWRGDVGQAAEAPGLTVCFEPQHLILGYVTHLLGLKFERGALGVGLQYDGKPIAGVVYNHYSGTNVHMTIATTDRRWCTPRVLRVLFGIPFGDDFKCRRVTATTLRQNKDVRAFLQRLGFRQEGSLRQAGPNGETAVLYGLTRSDCPWIMDPDQRKAWHHEQRRLRHSKSDEDR